MVDRCNGGEPVLPQYHQGCSPKRTLWTTPATMVSASRFTHHEYQENKPLSVFKLVTGVRGRIHNLGLVRRREQGETGFFLLTAHVRSWLSHVTAKCSECLTVNSRECQGGTLSALPLFLDNARFFITLCLQSICGSTPVLKISLRLTTQG